MATVLNPESGWSDANLAVGCFVKGDKFGKIALTNLTYNDNTKPFGEVRLIYIPSYFGSVYINILVRYYSRSGGSRRVLRVLDSAGNTVSDETYPTSSGDNLIWVSWEAKAGETYYLVARRSYDVDYIKSIEGVGYSAVTKYGKRDHFDYDLEVYEDYYDAVNSTTDRIVDVNFYSMGIPTMVSTLEGVLTITSGDIGSDKSVDIPFETNAETGCNFETDIGLVGVMVLYTNELYGKSDIFNSAKAEFIIGGESKTTMDLLTTPENSESSEFGISAGGYSDARVRITVNPKSVTGIQSFKVKVGFRWKFDSDKEALCT